MQNNLFRGMVLLGVLSVCVSLIGHARAHSRFLIGETVIALEEIIVREEDRSLDSDLPKWTLEKYEGVTYLRGSQNHDYGEGKLLFICTDKAITLYAFYYAGENTNNIIENGKDFSLMTGENKIYPLSAPQKFFNQNNWVNAIHELDDRLIERVLNTRAIVYMIRNEATEDRYRGFTLYIVTSEDRKLYRDYLSECMGQ